MVLCLKSLRDGPAGTKTDGKFSPKHPAVLAEPPVPLTSRTRNFPEVHVLSLTLQSTDFKRSLFLHAFPIYFSNEWSLRYSEVTENYAPSSPDTRSPAYVQFSQFSLFVAYTDNKL